jgi:hypothetical protein
MRQIDSRRSRRLVDITRDGLRRVIVPPSTVVVIATEPASGTPADAGPDLPVRRVEGVVQVISTVPWRWGTDVFLKRRGGRVIGLRRREIGGWAEREIVAAGKRSAQNRGMYIGQITTHWPIVH